MNISFIVPEIVRSGGIRVVFEYANRLLQRGHGVTVYTPLVPFNPFRPRLKLYYLNHQVKYAVKGIAGKNLPENIFEHKFKIKTIPSISSILIRDSHAVVATSWTSSYHVHKLKNKKCKKIYLIQDYELWNSNSELVNGSYRLPLDRVVVSKYLQDLLKDRFDAVSKKIFPGINYGKFYNESKVFNDSKIILISDHPLENKNVKGALKIIKMLKEKYPSLRIKCFGVKRFNQMPEYVEFHENPDDNELGQLYRSSDIFLYASLHEGFAATPAEAMACKCAVVTNRIGAIPEYSVHRETAMLADPGNPEELYEGVCYLLDNPAELERISFNGHDHIKKILNWDKSLDEFEKILGVK